MKDYNEMANAVFRRRDEFVAARKKRNGILLKAGTSVCALLLVAVVGISVWRALPNIPSVKPTEPTATVSADTSETTQAQKNTTTHTQPAVVETQEKTETKTEEPQAENIQKPTPATDPVESEPAMNDTPQTGDSLPPDPTEPKVDKPATDGNPDPTAATEAPNAPGWTPDAMPEVTTAACATMTPDYPYEPTTPVTPDAPTTQPQTGPLYIECSGKTYEAQTGDMITLTVELQADELIKSADVIAKYDYYYGRLEVVNLEDLGFTEKQLRDAHAPNLGDALSFINYDAGSYGRYRAVKLEFAAIENEYAPDFTEKKVLLTFSFMVKKPGNITIEVVPNAIQSVNGTEYFKYGNQAVFEGIDIEAYLEVIPAAEVVLPTPPEGEIKPEETPFTYPAESTDGELIINCDGRTYSANVGDTVTFITELKADEMFINIHVALDYPEEYLSFNVPQKGKQAFPNMYGMTYNFEGYKDFATGEVVNPAVIMVATDIYGFDFTSRQVLAKLEFEVIKAGEIDLDLHFEDMGKYNENGYINEAYFDRGVQKSFDDIYIYDYVLVEDKSSQ